MGLHYATVEFLDVISARLSWKGEIIRQDIQRIFHHRNIFSIPSAEVICSQESLFKAKVASLRV
jgi:hypothetical protein